MSWASHPTNEMPTTLTNPAGRHRRRRAGRVAALVAVVVLLPLGVAGAVMGPRLVAGPPASTAGGAPHPGLPVNPTPNGLAASAQSLLATTGPDAAAPALVTPAPAAPTTGAPAGTGLELSEDRVVTLTNQERTTVGCPALRADESLRVAARAHSDEMASHMLLTHTGATNNSNPGDRMVAAGYNPGTAWAENVAAGYPTAEAVMAGWMKSDGHRKNILNCSLKAIGVGVVRAGSGQLYWTQDFGGR